MNKRLLIVLLLVLCFSGCYSVIAEKQSTLPSAQKAVLDSISAYYNTSQHKVFQISSDSITIDGEVCIVIDVYGTTSVGTYLIEKFAVSQSPHPRFFFSDADDHYTEFQVAPFFDSSDSPCGEYRAEVIGMTDTYISGYNVPRKIRVIGLSDGLERWSITGTIDTHFWWSHDGRYLAVQCSGRKWTDVIILDTISWSEVYHTTFAEFFNILEISSAQNPDGVASFTFNGWRSDHSFMSDYAIDLEDGARAVGSFVYDLSTSLYTDTTVEIISEG